MSYHPLGQQYAPCPYLTYKTHCKIKPIFSSIFFVFFLTVFLRAQDIPDSVFREVIERQCPTCIDDDGNLLPAADSIEQLTFEWYYPKGINTLKGIELFTNVRYVLVFNDLSVMDYLPPHLEKLEFLESIGLVNITADIPTSLKHLEAHHFALHSIPDLSHTSIQKIVISNGYNLSTIGCLAPGFHQDSFILYSCPFYEINRDRPCDLQFIKVIPDVYMDTLYNESRDSFEISPDFQSARFQINGEEIYGFDNTPPLVLNLLPGDSIDMSIQLRDTFLTAPFIDSLYQVKNGPDTQYINIPIGRSVGESIYSLDKFLNGNFRNTMRIRYRNNTDSFILARFVKFVIPGMTNPYSMSVSPIDTINDTTFVFRLDSIKPNSFVDLRIVADFVPTPVDAWRYYGTLSATNSFQSKIYESIGVIRCRRPYDPNSILASPPNLREKDLINHKELYYTINFENIGQGPAFTVTLRDTFSREFDISSIKLIDQSHNNLHYNTFNLPDGEHAISFIYEAIQLPATAGQNRGHVTFSIELRPPFLSIGDSVLNEAHIYFDFNDPITTNVASTQIICNDTLVNLSHLTTGQAFICEEQGNGWVQIQILGDSISEFSYLWNTGDTTNRIDHLPPGTYTVISYEQAGRLCGTIQDTFEIIEVPELLITSSVAHVHDSILLELDIN